MEHPISTDPLRGAGTIGSQAAQYLTARGCIVYLADTAPRLAALGAGKLAQDWGFFAGQGKRVEGEYPDRIRHHVLDLSSVRTSAESAAEFWAKEQRLDIIVASAATRDQPQSELSPDGWERTWAIAHLGHVVLIKTLLRMLCLSIFFVVECIGAGHAIRRFEGRCVIPSCVPVRPLERRLKT